MIYAFSRDLSKRRMLFSVRSISWVEKYAGIGAFTLVAADNTENSEFLRVENILHFDGYDGIIKSVSVSEGEITANGYSLSQLLNQRIAYDDRLITQAEQGIFDLYNANRRELDVEPGELKGFEETVEVSVENGGGLGSWISTICQQCGLGFRVTLNAKTGTKVLEVYKGTDLTSPTDPKAVTFSTSTNTLSGLEINDDYSEFANVAIVRGMDLQEKYVVEIVGDVTGQTRHEVFVDATGDAQKDEQPQYDDQGNPTGTIPAETLEEYRARLRAKGAEELQERLSRTTFSVTVPAKDYGVRYKLGDVVMCYSKPHGIKLSARVSEVHKTIDEKRETLEVVLGEPQLKTKEMIRLWLK